MYGKPDNGIYARVGDSRMSKKSEKLTPDMLRGQWRIRSKSGAGYVGVIESFFDNAIVMKQINGETTIIFMDAIESMYEGLHKATLPERKEGESNESEEGQQGQHGDNGESV